MTSASTTLRAGTTSSRMDCLRCSASSATRENGARSSGVSVVSSARSDRRPRPAGERSSRPHRVRGPSPSAAPTWEANAGCGPRSGCSRAVHRPHRRPHPWPRAVRPRRRPRSAPASGEACRTINTQSPDMSEMAAMDPPSRVATSAMRDDRRENAKQDRPGGPVTASDADVSRCRERPAAGPQRSEAHERRDSDHHERADRERVGVRQPRQVAAADDHHHDHGERRDVERACRGAEARVKRGERNGQQAASRQAAKRLLGAAQAGVSIGRRSGRPRQ